jgi:hypothetical protein
VKGKFNYKNKIILKLYCRLTKFDVYKVTTHLCVPQFFHGQTCCQPAIRHKQLYSRFTVTCTFGPVLLPIPKFESLQFAIAKELGKNKQRHRLRVNSIIWWRNQTCIIDKFIKQSKKKQKIFRPTGFSVMEVCPKFGYCVNQLLYDSDEFLIWFI